MKKIITSFLFVLISLLVLVSCSGKSQKQVVGSYVNAMSYKEKAFFEALFPEDKKNDVETMNKSFEMFESEYGLIKAYFDGAKFEDEKGLAYGAYFKDAYNPLLSAYVAEAKSFIDKVKTGEEVGTYRESLLNYDGKFIDVHNGFLDLLEQ